MFPTEPPTDHHTNSVAHSRLPITPLPPAVSMDSINPKVIACEYAIFGEIVARAEHLEQILHEDPTSLPFDEIIYCNIGNPHSFGQQPITFFREVSSLCDYSAILDKDEIHSIFRSDSIARAKQIINSIPGQATGAYTHSKGVKALRSIIAEGIMQRDGYPADVEEIFLTNGATAAICMVMQLLISGRNDGILCPIPQYPLYSAVISLNGGTLVPYYLKEDAGWSLDVSELKLQLEAASLRGINVRAVVVINPGNPTGQVLSEMNQQEVVQFCKEENLLLIADEVYQENVYSENKKFCSFKRVARSMALTKNDIKLVSFHSTSKGYYGECSRRGGYMELIGLDEDVKGQIYKLTSINLCPNISGQIFMTLVMKPPKKGDASYEPFQHERDTILSSLAKRAKMLAKAFNKLRGISCNEAEGSLFLFPRLELPTRVIEVAKALGMQPDTFYCRQLLDETGIVVIPGSGCGQAPGTWHFRTTILPSVEKLHRVITQFTEFHERLMQKFQD